MTLQLVVTYNDNTVMYYPVTADGGWKIDAATRCLMVGRGVPRTFVPLDRVRSFDIEHAAANQPAAPVVLCNAVEDEGPTTYLCTEPLDHRGPHRTTVDGHVVAIWQQQVTS